MSLRRLLNKFLFRLGYQIKKINSGFWDSDSDFLALYKAIKTRTLVRIDRLYVLYQFAKSFALTKDGDVAQVGVFRGGTAKMIAECFKSSKKNIYLFDTFEGLPPGTENDGSQLDSADAVQNFRNIDFKDIETYFEAYTNVALRKGIFPGTTGGLENGSFCFVYLDVDLYQSIKDGLEFFYPRMVQGGIIIIDDYKSTAWPGVEKAVDEFCSMHNILPITTAWWQGIIIKL